MDLLKRASGFSGFSKQDVDYPYLVEIRPTLEEYELKTTAKKLREDGRIRRWHSVPHVTLVHNFGLRSGVTGWDLAELIQDEASNFSLEDLRFCYDGFELVGSEDEKSYALLFKVEPSKGLKRFRMQLYNVLEPYIEDSPSVVGFNCMSEDEFWFHAAIGYQMSVGECRRVKDSGQSMDGYLPAYPLRISIQKSGRTVYEYDCCSRRILDRRKALSKKYYGETVQGYRRVFGIETLEQINEKTIWFISDTHFDHKNIIKYCRRPFANAREMNQVLLNNWNNQVKNNDVVYCLGDISFGKKSRKSSYWLTKLNGDIRCVYGNHEEKSLGRPYELLKYKGYNFLLIHNHRKAKDFDGWIIHGHEHNNNLKKHPFIDGENKRINVSVETINYKPVSLDKIISLNLNKIKRMETITDNPEYNQEHKEEKTG